MRGHTTADDGADDSFDAPDEHAESSVTADRRSNPWVRFGVPIGAVALAAGAGIVLPAGDTDDSVKTAEASETTTSTTTTTTTVAAEAVFTEASATTVPVATTAVTTTTTTTTTTLAPTTTVAPTTTETLPEQPSAPIAPPSDPRGWEEQIQIGSISIPKLGVSEPLLEGIRLTTLDNGPGHWPGTAMPGQVGNVVVAAHRTSHGAPFRHIDQLVAGDIVNFEVGGQTIPYKVTSTQIVNPDAIWIVDPTDTATATLFACHPPGSVAQRIVVKLDIAL